MCGIVGIATESYADRSELITIFKEMLGCSFIRGMDSTGVFVSERKSKKNGYNIRTKWHKDIGDPLYFLNDDRVEKLLFKDSPFLMVGHTRQATVGAVTKENAHPFSHPTLIGVHNGTCDFKFDGREEYESDSNAIYALIDRVGIEKAMIDLQEKGWPKYALVWYDRNTKKLNFFRNKERPLWIVTNQVRNTIFFGSELGMIRWLLSRRGIQESTVQGTSAFMVPEHTLVSYDLNIQFFVDKRTETKIDVYPKKTYPTYSTPTGTQTHTGQKSSESMSDGIDGIEEDWDDSLGWGVGADLTTPVERLEKATNNLFNDIKDLDTGRPVDACDVPAMETPRHLSQNPLFKGLIWNSNKNAYEPPTNRQMLGSKESLEGMRFFTGFMGRALTQAEFEKKIDNGCGYCESIPLINNYKHFHWVNEDSFVCDACMSKPDVNAAIQYDPFVFTR